MQLHTHLCTLSHSSTNVSTVYTNSGTHTGEHVHTHTCMHTNTRATPLSAQTSGAQSLPPTCLCCPGKVSSLPCPCLMPQGRGRRFSFTDSLGELIWGHT